MDRGLAKGLSDRLLRQADAGHDRVQEDVEQLVFDTIRENRNRIRIPRKDLIRICDRMRSAVKENPAVIESDDNLVTGGSGAVFGVTMLAPIRSQMTNANRHRTVEYEGVALRRVEVDLDDKRLRMRRWLPPLNMTKHAITRYLERCHGKDLAAAGDQFRKLLRESIPAATIWSAMGAAMHDPWDDTLPREEWPDVILPHEENALCGTFATSRDASLQQARFIERRRKGVSDFIRHTHLPIVTLRTAIPERFMTEEQTVVTGLLTELMVEMQNINISPEWRRMLKRDMYGWPTGLDNHQALYKGGDIRLRALHQVLEQTGAKDAFDHWASTDWFRVASKQGRSMTMAEKVAGIPKERASKNNTLKVDLSPSLPEVEPDHVAAALAKP